MSTVGQYQRFVFLNSLIMLILSLLIAGYSLFLCVLFAGSTRSYSGFLYFVMIALTIVSLALATICIVGIRGALDVSLELLLLHFWGITVFIGPLILGVVVAFLFMNYIHNWVIHSWDSINFIKVSLSNYKLTVIY